MKVLHVLPGIPDHAGGPSRSVPDLCRALSSEGIEVTLFTVLLQGERPALDISSEPYSVQLFPSKGQRMIGALDIFKRICHSPESFDIIHIHSLWNLTASLAARAARIRGIFYIIAPRGMLHTLCIRRRTFKKRIYSYLLERKTIEAAARLHFLNQAEAQSSECNWFKCPEHFISPNGVDSSLNAGNCGFLPGRYPDLANRPIMLFLGRLHTIKALDLQLEAYRRLIPKYPRLAWVLIGPDKGEWPRIQGLARRAGIDQGIYWLGPLYNNDRFTALADSSVFVQTSTYEGHSIAVNEALCVGTPTVVTESVNFSEVQSSGAGCVVPSDPCEIALAIDSILASPALALQMRCAGRRFAAKHLAWPTIAKTIGQVYENVLSTTHSR